MSLHVVDMLHEVDRLDWKMHLLRCTCMFLSDGSTALQLTFLPVADPDT